MEIFKNNYFSLNTEDDTLYILVYRPGYDIKDFNGVVLDIPAIQLSDFNNLKNALKNATGLRTIIGKLRPRIEIHISSDEMEAKIKLNITAKEFVENKIGIPSEIIAALNKLGITEGLDNLFQKPITVQKDIIVAQGIPAIDGDDAKLTYFQPSDKKPIILEDGSVNHYELNLIDNVKEGDWLGERIPPTEGKPGKTVTGKIIPPRKGRDTKLSYDKKTVYECEENGKLVLRAAVDGAVKIDLGKIRLDNHLIIPEDVGFETGNINFEGYVTIKGTVKDGFTVTAKDDISIQGPMGVGAAEKIISTNGSIYIRGGVFGKGITMIEAKNNVYVKYCNQCNIIAGEDINIGFYAFDSNLTAKKITLDPIYGRVIGGILTAQVQVTAGVIGNKSEKKTIVNVQGFDRLAIKAEFDNILIKYKELLDEASKMKRQIEIFEYNISGAEYVSTEEYNSYLRKYEKKYNEIRLLDEARLRLQKILETKGEGEIDIFKAAYPETYLAIKNMQKKVNTVVNGSFYAVGRELHHT